MWREYWREDWRMAADDLTAPLGQETKRGMLPICLSQLPCFRHSKMPPLAYDSRRPIDCRL
jgi:hypothetical protein